MIDESIQRAINNSPDYSVEFTAHIAEIGHELQALLGVEIRHDSDMNYSHGQKLCLGLDDKGNPIKADKGNYCVEIFVSSKDNLFALIYLKNIGENEWKPINISALPLLSEELLGRIKNKLNMLGYKIVDDQLLNTLIPGHVTEMDGAPATLFNVLFSEVI